MKDREIRDYINDLIEACEDILAFTEGMSYSDFINDKRTINAVVRSLEVIGEATKKLPVSLKDHYPKVPWKQMAGMRDKLIHEYFGIDKQMVWKVVKEHIGDLLLQTKEITID
ncbi:MAG: hypothetical protein A2Z25_22685 [Planctomycetes bacterium RBG_16_55_9]|nr:MAG: hypothetical protein A2Z25_22685 [Planctomycetes bacterium RBG_16_55_9]